MNMPWIFTLNTWLLHKSLAIGQYFHVIENGSDNIRRIHLQSLSNDSRELNQPRRRRQQDRHKFAYLTMKNSSFARALFIFGHFEDVLVLCTT